MNEKGHELEVREQPTRFSVGDDSGWSGTDEKRTRAERPQSAYAGSLAIGELNEESLTPKERVRDGELGGGIGGITYCKEGTYPNYLYYYFHYNRKGDLVSG